MNIILILSLQPKYSRTSQDGHPSGNAKLAVLQRWQSYRGGLMGDLLCGTPYGGPLLGVLGVLKR